MAEKVKAKQEGPLEKKLWKTADKLRKNMDAAEYKHVVLGLIFLKYISDAFEELFQKLKAGNGEYEGADPEDKNEYIAEKVFYVPPQARWSYLMKRAKQPTIGKDVDDAMDALEKDNPSLKGVLPKVYAKDNLDKQSLGGLIDLIGTIHFMEEATESERSGKDLLGHVYEYFLGQFALAEGKKGGQFYTPQSVVKLLVEMLQPYEGRVYDPCCGSGGMFVQSEKFIEAHSDYYHQNNGKKLKIDPKDRISIYGQESNQTTWRLCKMNLAIRGIDSSNVKWNNEGSFLKDAHRDLKSDFIIANPPFNDSDWSGQLLIKDGRWQFGTPPPSNANFAWIQHIVHHLSPSGTAGFVLADSSMTAVNSDESEIRKNLIKTDLVDCMVTLPSHLFSNTQITACLWFLARNKTNGKFRNRSNEVLFIDGSRLGVYVKRKQRELTEEDVLKVSETYHSWRNKDSNYVDIPGFCESVSIDDIEKNDFILSPNRYVSTIDQEIELGVDFNDKSESKRLDNISTQLSKNVESLLNQWKTGENIQISKVHIAEQQAQKLKQLTDSYYTALIKKYFIDFNILNSSDDSVDSDLGPIPQGWEVRTFEDLFEERTERVKDVGYCPTIYSVTNMGIIPREGKYTKELSKSTENYKVAFKGDMVFGLSREIPNLDVMIHDEGAFSGAYSIYTPYDKRIGLIIGKVMRLKLMEQTDLLKGGAREGRGLDKGRLMQKQFAVPPTSVLNELWGTQY